MLRNFTIAALVHIAAFLAVAAAPHAQLAAQTPPVNLCRVELAAGDGSTFAGSGIVVARSSNAAAVLTAAHVVRDSTGQGSVHFAAGGTGTIAEIRTDKFGYDLALLLCRTASPPPPATPLGDWRPGDAVTWHGYGPSGVYATRTAPSALGDGIPAGWPAPDATLAAPCREGDSGGPVTDAHGRVVGVIWGAEPTATHFAPITPVRDFIRRCFGQPGWADSSSNCPGGVCQQPAIGLGNCPTGNCPLTQQPPAYLPQPSQTPPHVPESWNLALPADAPAAVDASPWTTTPASPTQPSASPPLEFTLPPTTDHGPRITDSPPFPWTAVLAGMGGFGLPATGVALGTWLARRMARRVVHRRMVRRENVRRDKVRQTKRRRHNSAPPASSLRSPASFSHPIAVDSPPQVVHAKTETHFVPIDDPKFDRAYAWSAEQIRRKFPGAADIIETLDSLIRQHLAGQKET